MQGVYEKSRLSTKISLYLGNDARYTVAIVTMEGELEITPKLSNDTSLNNLE